MGWLAQAWTVVTTWPRQGAISIWDYWRIYRCADYVSAPEMRRFTPGTEVRAWCGVLKIGRTASWELDGYPGPWETSSIAWRASYAAGRAFCGQKDGRRSQGIDGSTTAEVWRRASPRAAAFARPPGGRLAEAKPSREAQRLRAPTTNAATISRVSMLDPCFRRAREGIRSALA